MPPSNACTRPSEEHRNHGGGTAVLGDGVRVFRQFAWLEAGSGKMAFSRPAHQRVTRAVRCFRIADDL
jgi:hypothetical protein